MTLKLAKKKRWGLVEAVSREQALIPVVFGLMPNRLSENRTVQINLQGDCG